ncbi:MAG: hypothetical protein KatS3mg082_2977 [Nitrospiraceae bacterium]|nr:MAG: hypothetical protein KatS3mg082_2977 [Nitrospiraceae bacterium]
MEIMMEYSCESYRKLSRRALFAGAMGLCATRALTQVAFRKDGEKDGRVLVFLFLRGGCDGLNTIVPYGDDAYHRLRPSLALRKQDVLPLDDRFGMHPALRSLLPLYQEGDMVIVHAVGSQDRSRSHFEAMSAIERGVAYAGEPVSNGWVARYLAAKGGTQDPLQALAFAPVLPDSLKGSTGALALEDLKQYRLAGGSEGRKRLHESLWRLYQQGDDWFSIAGRQTLKALEIVERLPDVAEVNRHGYPASDLGKALAQTALLIESGVGLEVACLEKGGWDTHVAQGATEGWHPSLLTDLADSLAAFSNHLGKEMERVTVVVATEFGRRAYENAGLGTDHGRGSVLFVLGKGVAGGRIYGEWPGLEPEALEEPGDLRVTTDYRAVLSSVLAARMGAEALLPEVFPGYSGERLAVTPETSPLRVR